MWKVGNTVVTDEMEESLHDKAVNWDATIDTLIYYAIDMGADPEDAEEIVRLICGG